MVRGRSKFRQGHELPIAALDVVARERTHAPPAEILDHEGREDAAVDDRAAEVAPVGALGRGEIAEKAAREAVARPRGVEHLLQRERRNGEHRLRREEDRAVLPALDEDGLGAEAEDPARRPREIALARELARLL